MHHHFDSACCCYRLQRSYSLFPGGWWPPFFSSSSSSSPVRLRHLRVLLRASARRVGGCSERRAPLVGRSKTLQMITFNIKVA